MRKVRDNELFGFIEHIKEIDEQELIADELLTSLLATCWPTMVTQDN